MDDVFLGGLLAVNLPSMQVYNTSRCTEAHGPRVFIFDWHPSLLASLSTLGSVTGSNLKDDVALLELLEGGGTIKSSLNSDPSHHQTDLRSVSSENVPRWTLSDLIL